MDDMKLLGAPFPPSVNALYRSGRGHRGKVNRFKTRAAIDFEKAFDLWTFQNLQQINRAKQFARECEHTLQLYLSFKIDFVVRHTDLYTKTNTHKRIDCTNRIKALLDVMSHALELDDRKFFLGQVQFLIGETKCVNMELSKTPIRGAV